MKSRMLTRAVALALAVLLIGAVILGFSMLKERMAKTAQPAAQTDAAQIAAGKAMGPFVLYETGSKISEQSYISFSVYYRHDGEEELWYTCGRMFPAAQVAGIDWADSEFNILVTLKSGKTELFAYDGNNQWQ